MQCSCSFLELIGGRVSFVTQQLLKKIRLGFPEEQPAAASPIIGGRRRWWRRRREKVKLRCGSVERARCDCGDLIRRCECPRLRGCVEAAEVTQRRRVDKFELIGNAGCWRAASTVGVKGVRNPGVSAVDARLVALVHQRN